VLARWIPSKRRDRDVAAKLYEQAVAQARLPIFYGPFRVPDTLDGRFDMVVLHVYLLLRRLRAEGLGGGTLAQALFDRMFADMDQCLREIGVGDLSVGRKIKDMVKGFYGRSAAYDEGLNGNGAPLQAAVRRNVYGTVDVDNFTIDRMVNYIYTSESALRLQNLSSVCRGEVTFDAPLDEA
jgi:cytochrome b pre-mRNA-processing protein 3